MREILFRGKQSTDKVWVFGGIETISDGKPYICKRARYRPDTRDWDTAEYYEKDPHYTRACVVVDPETVGQWTGRVDKNGTKIFEGDIVKTEFGRLCVVVWFSSPVHCGWDFESIRTVTNCAYTQPPLPIHLWREETLEVVGNKWDNPELFEEGE